MHFVKPMTPIFRHKTRPFKDRSLNRNWDLVLLLLTLHIHHQLLLILIPEYVSQSRPFFPIPVNAALFQALAIFHPDPYSASSQKLPLSSGLPRNPTKARGRHLKYPSDHLLSPFEPFRAPPPNMAKHPTWLAACFWMVQELRMLFTLLND